MAFTASTMLELLVVITWSCLTIAPTKAKHSLFSQVLPSQAFLSEIASAASLFFCPGLFEVIGAVNPPPLSFFKGLPSDSVGIWGIYVVVLEKKACIPLIYAGSGTASKSGVRGRFGEYNRGVHLPRYVKQALDNGYKIVQKGLLVWCPIPPAADIPKLRVLFVAIEAAFGFLFWAMQSQTKDYSMGKFCPWSRDSFSYHGLCSHSPLSEGAAGDFGLTNEEIEVMAAQAKEKSRAYHAKYHQNRRARSPERFHAQRRNNDANFKANAPDKVRKNQKASRERAKANKKYFCATCDVSCRTKIALTAHNSTKRHLKRVAEPGSGST
jgi:hypothetical protein